MNEIGHVTGWTGNGELSINALGFVYVDGDIEFIEPVENGLQSSAFGINSHIEVVGTSRIEANQGPPPPHPFHWFNGTTSDLGPFPGDDRAHAISINDDQMIVGVSSKSTDHRACIWFASQAYDINDLIEPQQPSVSVRSAGSITNQGMILGHAVQSNKQVGVLLTPIERPLGDLTGDCAVGVDDLVFLLSEWGKTESPADLNKDGLVDGADLGILLSNWTMP